MGRSRFADGTPVPRVAGELLAALGPDGAAFRATRSRAGPGSFRAWLAPAADDRAPGDHAAVDRVHAPRADLREAFPDPLGADRAAFARLDRARTARASTASQRPRGAGGGGIAADGSRARRRGQEHVVRRLGIWLAIAAGVFAGGKLLERIGLPSSYLFAALLIGLAIALARPGSVAMTPLAFRAAQAVAGVSLGAYLQADALRAVAGSLVPVLLVTAGTLGLSLAAGAILARTTELDPATAALGLIAGGASGIVGMSGELGADDRLVAFMQYLRVLVVVVVTPIGIALFFGGQHGAAAVPGASTFGEAWEWAATVAFALAGAAAAARLRITAGVLLGPMVVTGAVVLSGLAGDFAVPSLLGQTAFALIGLQVGLRFTVETVKLLGRLTLPVVLAIVGLLAASFGLAVLLAASTSATLLDAYLATTPGGLYAVLAVAFGAGADTTFIVAVQSLRVIVMVLVAPMAVRLMLSRRDARRRSRTTRRRPATASRVAPPLAKSRGPVPKVRGYTSRCSSSTNPSASMARTRVALPLTYRSPVLVLQGPGSTSGSYVPTIFEFRHVPVPPASRTRRTSWCR